MQTTLNELKKTIFYKMLDMAGRVFIMVKHSSDIIIGKRGLTEDEKKNGIVLVFNSTMKFIWDDYGISGTLIFGTVPQECHIPADDIIIINSPELNAQFVAAPRPPEEADINRDRLKDDTRRETRETQESSKVVQVDFKKKRDKSSPPAKP